MHIHFRIQSEEKFKVRSKGLVRYTVERYAIVHIFFPVDRNFTYSVNFGVNDHEKNPEKHFDSPTGQQVSPRQTSCSEFPDKPRQNDQDYREYHTGL
ncbi:hypothetical protein D3C86_1441880 [compost metagenome]